jgi:hypothetical protein
MKKSRTDLVRMLEIRDTYLDNKWMCVNKACNFHTMLRMSGPVDKDVESVYQSIICWWENEI